MQGWYKTNAGTGQEILSCVCVLLSDPQAANSEVSFCVSHGNVTHPFGVSSGQTEHNLESDAEFHFMIV